MVFAHGFLTLSHVADVQYKASGFWNRDCERSMRWDDPDLAIQWPLHEVGVSEPLLATKDETAPLLATLESAGEVFLEGAAHRCQWPAGSSSYRLDPLRC